VLSSYITAFIIEVLASIFVTSYLLALYNYTYLALLIFYRKPDLLRASF